ncbi:MULTISPECIES: hypothetical protein [Bacteria]|uniref:hypothetical protein n=1 Tax=Bacteria TaxID=2 RepID=UPI0036378042
MRTYHPFRRAILLMLFFVLLTSCRLGKIMSEADPDTKTEVETEKDSLDLDKG